MLWTMGREILDEWRRTGTDKGETIMFLVVFAIVDVVAVAGLGFVVFVVIPFPWGPVLAVCVLAALRWTSVTLDAIRESETSSSSDQEA